GVRLLRRRLEHHAADVEGLGRGAAVGVVVVGEPVAVVVDAVAADLDLRAGGHVGAVRILAVDQAVPIVVLSVRAILGRVRRAAVDRRRGADARRAGVGRAGVVVVAVGVRRAGRARGVHDRAAGTGDTGLGGAGVAVVGAVGVDDAGRAARIG